MHYQLSSVNFLLDLSKKAAFGRKHCRPLARRKESHWFIFRSDRGFFSVLRVVIYPSAVAPVLLSSAQSLCSGSLSAHLLPGTQRCIQQMMKRSQSPTNPHPTTLSLDPFTLNANRASCLRVCRLPFQLLFWINTLHPTLFHFIGNT